MVRYNIDGSLDNTFGTNGTVITQLKKSSSIASIAIQTDGKIIAGGSASYNTSQVLVDTSYTITRYNVNGSIDSVFGKNGTAAIKMAFGLGELKKILIKPDGKILTAGTVSQPTFEYMPVLVQLLANGSPDSSFGTNGKAEGYIDNIEKFTDMAFAKDGKILLTGQIKNWGFIGDFALIRFFQNGRLDSSFGTNGVVKTDFNGNTNNNRVENAMGLIVLPDSSIVLAGYNVNTPSTFALAKYKANGTLDNTFGVGGKVITPIHNTIGYANDILADLTSSLFVSGYADAGSNSNFAIVKYFPNGKPDSSFGKNGIDTTNFSGFADVAYASALQADGKIVLAGQAGNASKYSIGLARYKLTVLPLKLLTFTASKDGNNNLLQWNTAQEASVDRFEVEASTDGKVYNSIGKIFPGSPKYIFTHSTSSAGVNYYRLKVVDKDGKFDYSPVRIVVSIGSFYVSVFPLPAKDNLNIQIQPSQATKATISITDVSGKTVITNSILLTVGINTTFINTKSLSKGIYFLKVVTSEATETTKIIID